MKRIFSVSLLVLIGALATARQASAQLRYDGPTTVISGGTNGVNGSATNTVNHRIDVPATEAVALGISFKLMAAAGTSNLTVRFAAGNDGSGGATNADFFVWAIPANSTTLVNAVTNVSVGSIPFLFLRSIENTNSQILTNLTVTYGFKRQR